MLNTASGNLQKENIERINRENFRVMMDCLSRPGSEGKLEPLFGSPMLAAASTLLYQEVSWFSLTEEDFTDVALLTGSREKPLESADYVFCGKPSAEILPLLKKGTHESPELGATVFFMCDGITKVKALLTGPGIDCEKTVSLPVDEKFAAAFRAVNAHFPVGTDVFFIGADGTMTALARTTSLEVL